MIRPIAIFSALQEIWALRMALRGLILAQILLVSPLAPAKPSEGYCQRLLEVTKTGAAVAWVKKQFINRTLDVMAAMKGLPKYLKLIKEIEATGRYVDDYDNFGVMGLAEMGISIRFNQAQLQALDTGKPLIIVANHHLGIADGLALQYLSSRARRDTPSLLFLARWIEKILPFAVYGDQKNWGTAVPVEINLPKEGDPEYEAKLSAVKNFNKSWSRQSLKVLKAGGALIIFPAGHVASIDDSAGPYPASVFDSPGSWQEGYLNLARLGKAEIVFAHVDSVNSEAFYRKRKRFGGGDRERVIWFFSEALAKRNKSIDVYLSKPMSLETIYEELSQKYGVPRENLEADSQLSAELMRRYTYEVSKWVPQSLDTQDLPRKNAKSQWRTIN